MATRRMFILALLALGLLLLGALTFGALFGPFFGLVVFGVVLVVIFGALALIPKLLAILAKLAVYPVLAPLECWWSIQERRENGERVGSFMAGYEMAWSIVIGALLWLIFFGLPLAGFVLWFFDQQKGT